MLVARAVRSNTDHPRARSVLAAAPSRLSRMRAAIAPTAQFSFFSEGPLADPGPSAVRPRPQGGGTSVTVVLACFLPQPSPPGVMLVVPRGLGCQWRANCGARGSGPGLPAQLPWLPLASSPAMPQPAWPRPAPGRAAPAKGPDPDGARACARQPGLGGRSQ